MENVEDTVIETVEKIEKVEVKPFVRKEYVQPTNTKMWSDYAISTKLIGHEHYAEFVEKLNELIAIGDKLAPEGRFSLAISSKDEKFRDIDMLVSNGVLSKKVYNEKSIMSNPENATEYASLLLSAKSFNAILDKKRKKIKESRNKQSVKR